MVARLQQFAVSSIFGAVVLWVYIFLTRGSVVLALLGPLCLFLGYAALLGAEFALIALLGDSKETNAPATSLELVRAWGAELALSPRVFCWRQPFRAAAEADSLPANDARTRSVVFVHGFLCNRGFWNPWMKRLRVLGVPFVAVSLEPPFSSIDSYVDAIDAAVARCDAPAGSAPVIVAHSMGGLAVRAWIAKRGAAERVHRVVTIGCPHRGTWLARFARSANTAQMKPDGPWLGALAAIESESDGSRFVCFYGNCDNVVFPSTSGMLPGADNRHLRGTPHVKMAFHDDVVREVLRLVAPDPSPGRTPRPTLL